MSEQIKIIHRKMNWLGVEEKFSEFNQRVNDFAKENNAKQVMYIPNNIHHGSFFIINYEA